MDFKFQRVRDVKAPQRGTSRSAGIDFFVPNDFQNKQLLPGDAVNIPSGIKCKIPEGYALIAFNKSGVALKGLQVGACVVDEDYQGEVHLHVYNRTKENIMIKPGEKLVQFALVPVLYANIVEVEDLEFGESERGIGAFGSTNNFAYFDKPISECTDQELIDFYVAFCNGADPNSTRDQKDYSDFKAEVPNRSKAFQDTIAEIDAVL